MPLQVETGVNKAISPFYSFVGMGTFLVSSGRPLYTHGAGPCLNIVVHNDLSYVGGLAHVAFGTGEDLSQRYLFDKAIKTVTDIAAGAGSSSSSGAGGGGGGAGSSSSSSSSGAGAAFSSAFQALLKLINNTQTASAARLTIWLGAGWAFSSGTSYEKVQTDKIGMDFVDYLTAKVAGLAEQITIIDDRGKKGTGDVVYSPHNARVYIMEEGDLEFVRENAANATTIQAERRKKLSLALKSYYES